MNRVALIGALLIGAPLAHAQVVPRPPAVPLISAGSEWERYLRVLQLTGRAPLAPWGVRAFGPEELRVLVPRDSGHVWERQRLVVEGIGVVAPEARMAYNTAFPFGYNDGAVWAGRGATVSAAAGITGRWGAFSATVAPTAFVAQNAAFTMRPNSFEGDLRFGHTRYQGIIDAPQRFGADAYGRIDWGQTTIRVDLAGAAVGVSTANQFWGPAVEHPFLLGTNAPGFAHAFLGTSRPLDIWVGRLHGRAIWGRLEQSDYSTVTDDRSRRFAAGLVATFTPRGIAGLEIGGGRFFHTPWPADGLTADDLLKPFEGILKQTLASEENPSGDQPRDNQLASLFARWVFPASRVEVYAEYGREDHSWDARDLWLEPDHISAYVLGIQRAWERAGGVLVGRAELLNARISHLQQGRGQSPVYVHGVMAQGHTHRGQVLGSHGGPGGGAAVLAGDYYTPGGRITVSWSRLMQAEAFDGVGVPNASEADVMHALGADVRLFRRKFDVTGGVTAVQNFNRNGAGDAFNLNLTLGASHRW